MDLPTYTNIWRIEKRLYKLYDFRLPMPLPISWIAVFCGITIPYVGILAAIGLPFNHNLLWLYVLPPGVLTWLTTRPVLENKRLPELLVSQLRYVGEPRTWCRLTPLSEKNEIRVYARVWHRAPAYAEEAELLTAPAARSAREGASALAPALRGRGLPAVPEPRPGTGRGSGPVRRTWQARPGRPDQVPQPVQVGPRVWPHAGIAPVRATGDAAGAGGPRELSVRVRAGSDRASLGRAATAARRGTGRSAPGWTGLARLTRRGGRGAPAEARARADGFGCDLPGTETRHPGPSAERPRSGRSRGGRSRSGRSRGSRSRSGRSRGSRSRSGRSRGSRSRSGRSRSGRSRSGRSRGSRSRCKSSRCGWSRCGPFAADSAAYRGGPRDAGAAGAGGRSPLGPPVLSPSRAQRFKRSRFPGYPRS